MITKPTFAFEPLTVLCTKRHRYNPAPRSWTEAALEAFKKVNPRVKVWIEPYEQPEVSLSEHRTHSEETK